MSSAAARCAAPASACPAAPGSSGGIRAVDPRVALTTFQIEDEFDFIDRVEVEFDDGVITTTARTTIFSAYLWEYHRLYPKTPLLKDRHHIGERRLGAGTHLNILGSGMFDAYDAYGGKLRK